MYTPEFVAFLALGWLLSLGFLAWQLRLRQRDIRRQEEMIEELRQQKAPRPYDGAARATLKGQLAEQVAPLLPGFPFHPSDFRFLGQPIDFICYVGLTEAKEGLGDIEEVVLGDIKLGSARLSKHQAAIKRAVEEKRVRWVTIHIDQDFAIRRRK